MNKKSNWKDKCKNKRKVLDIKEKNKMINKKRRN